MSSVNICLSLLFKIPIFERSKYQIQRLTLLVTVSLEKQNHV